MGKRKREYSSVEDEQNAEANYFAAQLLVPASLLRAECIRRGIDLFTIDLVGDEPIASLARAFEVSVPLMTARIQEERAARE